MAQIDRHNLSTPALVLEFPGANHAHFVSIPLFLYCPILDHQPLYFTKISMIAS
jgi:hypothetical protein